MAVSALVTVGTTATQLNPPVASGGISGDTVVIQNTGAAAVFIGGPDVATSGATIGYSLAAGASLVIPTDGGISDLWGRVATGTNTVTVLRV